MTDYKKISQVALFYIILIILILIVPTVLGGIGAYSVIIILSLTFMIFNGIKVVPGGLAAGSIASIVSMTSIFAILLISGSISVLSVKPDALTIVAFGVLLQIFVAFGEELSFRGFIFRALDESTGRKAAAIVSSAMFALLHTPSMLVLGISPAQAAIAAVSIFIASIVLTVLYIYGGLLNAVAFHFFWNLIQYHFIGTGPLDSALKVETHGNPIITGGAFGPEASIVGLLTISTVLAVLWWHYRKRAPLIARKKSSS